MPKTIERNPSSSRGSEPCGSWLSPGIAAAFCATGLETPAPNGSEGVGQVRFTGTPRAGAEGGIAQAAGTLPAGTPIGIHAEEASEGTLVAQGICDRTLVHATFRNLRFAKGDVASVEITQAGATPVIFVKLNDRQIAADDEQLFDLQFMPAAAPHDCAFRVA
jgi:hypothetical protein